MFGQHYDFIANASYRVELEKLRIFIYNWKDMKQRQASILDEGNEDCIKMGPSVMRRYAHRLGRAVPTLYKYIGKNS